MSKSKQHLHELIKQQTQELDTEDIYQVYDEFDLEENKRQRKIQNKKKNKKGYD